MIKVIDFFYRWIVIHPRNFIFRIRVAWMILTGPFLVIGNIKVYKNGHKFFYKIRTLGVASDKIRRRILLDAENYYVLKNERIKKNA